MRWRSTCTDIQEDVALLKIPPIKWFAFYDNFYDPSQLFDQIFSTNLLL